MAKPASRPAKHGGSPVFTGIVIGLALGVLLAAGVAVLITGANPFNADKSQSATRGNVSAPATPEPAPSFDFYKVLPGDAANALPSVPEPAAPVPRYFLQAGAFQNAADADNLKAQLALLGVEALIQTTEVQDKGVFHRVRVGPFRAMDEVNRTRSLLAQNNIPATLVREEPQ